MYAAAPKEEAIDAKPKELLKRLVANEISDQLIPKIVVDDSKAKDGKSVASKSEAKDSDGETVLDSSLASLNQGKVNPRRFRGKMSNRKR